MVDFNKTWELLMFFPLLQSVILLVLHDVSDSARLRITQVDHTGTS